MQNNTLTAAMIKAGLAASVLLCASGAALGQVSLTAAPATATLPNGSAVPMWGYTCAAPVTGQIGTCTALNPAVAAGTAPAGTWSPVVITVPTGQNLTISLTNSLSFANGNTVPTSLTIVGQVGGGLGAAPTRAASPTHGQQGVTWAVAGTPGGTNPTFTPPPQGARVQSFATEVAAGATTVLSWTAPAPGTYLLESGTHPSIQGPMGLYGVVVVTAAPTPGTAAGCAYPGAAAGTCAVPYDADIAVLLSEIDPVQNAEVATAVTLPGFSETTVWSGQPGGCGNPATTNSGNCYPPAVNYTPLYYLINGVAFDKTHPSASLFPASAAIASPPLSGTATGSVLVRLVNAGLHMHVPAIVGSQTGVAPSGGTIVPTGFSLIAEDGNPLPGLPRVQSEVFMAAGKTNDVMINGPAAASTAPALAVYDRELSLSGNAISRDAGMLAYISVNGAGLPAGASASAGSAVARADSYPSLLAGKTLTVSDPSKGVIANDTNVFGVQLLTLPANGTVTLNANGTFTYVPTGAATSDNFSYCANGSVTAGVCSSGITAAVSLTAATLENASGISVGPKAYTANVAGSLSIKPSGVLSTLWSGCTPSVTNPCHDRDAGGYPITVYMPTAGATSTAVALAGPGSGSATINPDGSFAATVSAAGTYTFTYQAQNSQGVISANSATVTLTFPAASGLNVTVQDPTCYNAQIASGATAVTAAAACAVTDYRWVIEEDQTFYVNPNTTANTGTSIVPTLGVNFHTSHMPFVAQGCTGTLSCEGGQSVLGVPSVCDVGNGVCRPDPTSSGFTQVLPGAVALDPTKRYYISVLPGDAANPFIAAYTGAPDCTTAGHCGHGMGGAPITFGQTAVTVLTQPSPYPPAKLSVFVFEDDFPLNGENDSGGGIDVLSPQEPGLGGFQIHLWDAMGGNGDFTGQMTYDMFNMPLTNSLDGTTDPNTGLNACPITAQGLNTTDGTSTGNGGITGMIVTCPKYEGDGQTLSPLAGQAVIANLMPGRFGVVASPAADRIARGEEWLQTNTLDGQKAHDSFVRIGEPSYFQEFGPASFHVSIGFANPAIINARHPFVCNGTDANITGTNCTFTVTGRVVGERLSRTPDERLYGSGSHDAFSWTQCYASFGDPDGEDFAFTKCNGDGYFTLSNLPQGDWRLTTFDQWNDQLVDGLSTPVRVGTITAQFCPGPKTSASAGICDLGDVAATQWQTNVYTRTFIDDNKDGISQASEAGIPFSNVAVRLRDGSLENLLVSDFTGTANFNETFPLFSWYVVETDVTRYKNTGTHVIYDVGGPADGSPSCGVTGYPPCGNSLTAKYLANTAEQISVPAALRVPGAVYCGLGATADCTGKSIQNGPGTSDPSNCTLSSTGVATCSATPTLSSGRIDPPWAGGVEGWQGFPGQNSFIEFGKEPYVAGENGGIKGHVIYASTRPFDDPMMLVQTQWEPLVPHVTINLYQEGFAADGVTPTLTLVDTTQTSSWDDYAQGFRNIGTATAPSLVPNMNCPGQGAATGPLADLFFFSLYQQPEYLDYYNNVLHGPVGATPKPLPANSQFKCYDGMHNWNQVQPAPYDGMYQFPSVTSIDPATGKPNGTNCTICTGNPVAAPDLYAGLPMLPVGKYVVEIVLPSGFELVKEEDKNILIGDDFIAPVTNQFGGLGNVFIMPDQASVASQQQYAGPAYNANNAQNSTVSLGTTPSNNIVPGFIPEPTWPCVGALRIVPDYISLYPQTHQVSPFAGASRRLCDRKEVTLSDQMGAIAKFYVYTSVHVASKFTGGITDDYTSEFDPFSPQFGEKFAPPDLPVSVRDWAGNETNRVYADHWGSYNGMTYSTWEVNPPNPTGYSPTMMVFCMNDPGPIVDTRATIVNSAGLTVANPTLGQTIKDPLYAEGYSQFCYELPFMPGTTQYLDTPVVPTSAFAGAGYNNVDCAYPNATPAIKEVDGDGIGPWVSDVGHTLTITALGDFAVPNNAYSGPSATTAPYNQKTMMRHYGFGAAAGTVALVGSNGVAHPLTNVSWGDLTITGRVPNGVPACAIQQQSQYGGSIAQCGELIITAANGQKSVDTVTVTIGGKAPTVLTASNPLTQNGPGAIQSAIDAAQPGDLIIVPPGAYQEMVLMWKPVRLQGVGAASSVINANTQPNGKLDPWRRQVDCLFGLSLNGQPISRPNPVNTTPNPFDPSNTYSCPGTGWTGFMGSAANPQVDRLPLEATLGWDASLNGNMAELLQEPSLMGALEGAAITVLAKGVDFHGANPNDPTLLAAFPTGTTVLTSADCETGAGGSNPNPSNFQCNPASIDGLGITDSSQGGGGIFVHAWGHNLQIANNRVQNNAGTLSGGINVGQGEFPPSYIQGGTTNAAPGSCETSGVNGAQLPYCHNLNVNVHNNFVSLNSSTGDELFSATPAGAGGISFCTGADYYQFNYNWVCGNLSSGDGGGFGHVGFSKNGDIEHNTFVFNQSINPTIPANGGGLIIMGSPDADPTCGANTDADCVPTPASIGPSDGVGPGLKINANLIMGNAAESGTGGGIAFQSVNGSEVIAFPTTPSLWYHVTVTNNIIVDNVAGWDGGGISLLDALNTDIVNNTIASNVTTADAGILFTTLGGPIASQQGPTCTANCGTTSKPQPAGLVSLPNSAVLTANIAALPAVPATRTTPAIPAGTIDCPARHGGGTSLTAKVANGTCKSISYPLLGNNVLWHNSSYFIGVGALSPVYQQNVVGLYNAFTTSLAASQTSTGACIPGASFWDLGVRGDTSPTTHTSGFTLQPNWSVLTSTSGYAGNNTANNPDFVSMYCNGSRQPPESGISGWQVPPGIADASVPNPIFNLTPVATVDEGNNWVNLRWGPLTMSNPVSGVVLGNYALQPASTLIDHIPSSASTYALALLEAPTDFFGNARPDDGSIDVGAIEAGAGLTAVAPALTSITPSSGTRGTTFQVVLNGTNLAGVTAVTISGSGVSHGAITSTSPTAVTLNFTIGAGAAGGARNVTVTSPGGISNAVTFTVTVPTLTSIAPNTGERGHAVNVTLTGINLSAATGVTVSGGGVTVSHFVVVNSTTVTATFTIANNAANSARTVMITSPGSNTNAVAFTVTGATAGFTGPTPALTGTPVTAAKTGTITVTNTVPAGATAGPLTLTAAPTVTRTVGTGVFTITGGTCASGMVIAQGGHCTISVHYAPPTTCTTTATATCTATAHVTVADTGATTASQNSANFNGN